MGVRFPLGTPVVIDLWLTDARLVLPDRVADGAVAVRGGRIAAIRRSAPAGAHRIRLAGSFLAPGLVDLHIWGDPVVVSEDAAHGGTTAFFTTLGPEPAGPLAREVARRAAITYWPGAECVGIHLEGPYVNPVRAGALPKGSLRWPSVRELDKLARVAKGRIRMVTLAPELPGALEAIRWCHRHGVVASLGHSAAGYEDAIAATDAGARAVTHVFNGMPPLNHHQPGLIDAALTEARLTGMLIADGVHVSPHAMRLLLKAKGPGGVVLVTDSIRRQGWKVVQHKNAYYLRGHRRLAGSALTMLQAVRNTVMLAGASVSNAVTMASAVPARLAGLHSRGTLAVGRRADLTAFDRRFAPVVTVVGGHVCYER